MIVVYPMLTSGSVSPNALPGIIKAVEKYILLYNTDEVLRTAGATAAGQIISTGGSGIGKVVGGHYGGPVGRAVGGAIGGAIGGGAFESHDVSEAGGIKAGTTKVKQQAQKVSKILFQPGTSSKDSKYDKPSLDFPRGDAISLEPTWTQVTTRNKGLQLLGVKVVPFRIKSSDTIPKLIANDKKLKSLDFLAAKYGRGMTRVLQRILRKIPFMKNRPLTGDPVNDILLGKTQYKSNMFICLSQMDLENEDIFTQPGGIQKLHKLGWASFIIVDDVNRRTTFCMREFGGVCSVVPFSFMFTSYGKDYNQAYEDLEDIRKASGPFFNMRTNRKRMFTEASMTNVDKYLQLIQGK